MAQAIPLCMGFTAAGRATMAAIWHTARARGAAVVPDVVGTAGRMGAAAGAVAVAAGCLTMASCDWWCWR